MSNKDIQDEIIPTRSLLFTNTSLLGVFQRSPHWQRRPSLCHPKVMRYIKRQGTTRLRGPACVRNGDHGPITGGMTDDDRLG